MVEWSIPELERQLSRNGERLIVSARQRPVKRHGHIHSRRAALSPGHHHDCNDALCDCAPCVMHAFTDLQTSHRTCADPRCVAGSTFSPAPSSIRPATAGNAYTPPHAGDDSSSDCSSPRLAFARLHTALWVVRCPPDSLMRQQCTLRSVMAREFIHRPRPGGAAGAEWGPGALPQQHPWGTPLLLNSFKRLCTILL